MAGVSIARELYRGLKQAKKLRPITITRPVSTMRVPGQASGGLNPEPTTYRAEGFLSSTSKRYIGGTLVESADRIISVAGYKLATDPRNGDKVTLAGVTSRVIGVDVDGERAMFTLLTRV